MPIACISWTFTHEEVFREVHNYCVKCSKQRKTLMARKFFYLLTCEYCFSHYIALLFVLFTKYQLLFSDWRGYIIGGFSLVWVANFYMSYYAGIRVRLKGDRAEAELKEEALDK
ncbi:hypothetical protein KRR40_46155 [Niabella defluvii]|nr:hypothetical protein KRR40_46155 [Niabella sp. I65]